MPRAQREQGAADVIGKAVLVMGNRLRLSNLLIAWCGKGETPQEAQSHLISYW